MQRVKTKRGSPGAAQLANDDEIVDDVNGALISEGEDEDMDTSSSPFIDGKRQIIGKNER